jgi:hypothetical protein
MDCSFSQLSPRSFLIMNKLTELEDLLYEKCREDPDLLATIISEYVWNLSGDKLTELEDFLANNFGDD